MSIGKMNGKSEKMRKKKKIITKEAKKKKIKIEKTPKKTK